MMRQYRNTRPARRGLLFFRLGDFYEMFLRMPRLASRLLGLTLTGRGAEGKRARCAACRTRAAESYINKLIRGSQGGRLRADRGPAPCQGHRQAQGRAGLHPGTVVSSSLLEAKANNFLLSRVQQNPARGAAALGPRVLDLRPENSCSPSLPTPCPCTASCCASAPSEIIFPKSASTAPPSWKKIKPALGGCLFQPSDDLYFDFDSAYRALLDHFRVSSLDGFGCEAKARGRLRGRRADRVSPGKPARKLPHLSSLPATATRRS
jgi:DNA mismatch repair protein MutS